MTSDQFKTFMGLLDASLSEIGREMAEGEVTSDRLFLMALNRKLRQGLMEITKHIAEGGRSPREAERQPYITGMPIEIHFPTPVDLYYQHEAELQKMFS